MDYEKVCKTIFWNLAPKVSYLSFVSLQDWGREPGKEGDWAAAHATGKREDVLDSFLNRRTEISV
jgi:hypothetical protein